MAKATDITASLSGWQGRPSTLPSSRQSGPRMGGGASGSVERRPVTDAFTCLVYGLLAAALLSQVFFLLLWDFWRG